MITVNRTVQFKKDYKREKRTDPAIEDRLKSVVDLLLSGKPLPTRFSDHPLSGNWKGYRDCHIRPDLVLIYQKTPDQLTLVRLGSHAEIFG